MPRAFPYRSDCPIASIGAISGSLIEDCTISAAPAAIWSMDFNFFPPTSEFDFGCYCTKVKTRIIPSTVPSFTAEWKTNEAGNCCDKSLVLTAQGEGCTEPRPKQDNVKYVMANQGEITLVSTTNEQGACLFDFFLGIPNTLACPSLVGGSVKLHFKSWWSSHYNSSSWHWPGYQKSSAIDKGWEQYVPVMNFHTSSLPGCTYNPQVSLSWPSASSKLLNSLGQLSKSSWNPTQFYDQGTAGLTYITDFKTPPATTTSATPAGGLDWDINLQLNTAGPWPLELLIYGPVAPTITPITGGIEVDSPAGLVCNNTFGVGCQGAGGAVSTYDVDYARNLFGYGPYSGIGYVTVNSLISNPLHFKSSLVLYDKNTTAAGKWGCVNTISLNAEQYWGMQVRKNTWNISPYTSYVPDGSWNLITTLTSGIANDCSCAYSATPSRRLFRQFPSIGLTSKMSWLSSQSWSSSTEWRYYSMLDFQYGLLVDFQFLPPEVSEHP